MLLTHTGTNSKHAQTHSHRDKTPPSPRPHFADLTSASQRGWMKTCQDTSPRSLFLFGPNLFRHSRYRRMLTDWQKTENIVLIIFLNVHILHQATESKSTHKSFLWWPLCFPSALLPLSHFFSPNFSLYLYHPACPSLKVWIRLKPYVLHRPWDVASVSFYIIFNS